MWSPYLCNPNSSTSLILFVVCNQVIDIFGPALNINSPCLKIAAAHLGANLEAHFSTFFLCFLSQTILPRPAARLQ